MTLKLAVFLSSAVALLSTVPAQALVTSTKAITCSSTTRLQAAIDAVPSGAAATFNVSGTCNENITVPVDKTVTIVGATATAKITAANALLPAVTVKGDVTLRKLTVTNVAGTAEALIETQNGGALYVISSDLSAPAVESVIGAWSGEITVSNSRVVGGVYSAFDVWGSTLLRVQGDPLHPVGPTGRYESYVKSSGDGIDCGQGASLRIVAKSKGMDSGIVTIEQNATGVAGNQCSVTIVNKTTDRSRVRIRYNKTGVYLQQSKVIVDNAQIVNNSLGNGLQVLQSDLVLSRSLVTANQVGVNAEQSHVRIDGSTLSNMNGDVQAGDDSHVQLVSWSGVSSFPKALNWDSSFNCWNGSRIDIESGAMTPALGPHYDFLDCLFVQ